MVCAAVGGDLDDRAVQREAAPADPIRVSTDDAAEEASFGEVVREAVEAEDDIVDGAVPIRRAHGDERRAVRHHADLHTVNVRQRKRVDGRAVRQVAEWCAGHGREERSRCKRECRGGGEQQAHEGRSCRAS